VGRDLFVARVGLGVSRLAARSGVVAADFRTHDLAMQRRALSIATDARNNVWLVGEDGGPVRYTGAAFSRVELGDARLHPLMFWSRGSTVVSIARVGDTNMLRGFRLDGGTWRRAVEGPVETYGPGTVDAKFLAVDNSGRFWVGLRVLPPPGAPASASARELGVAVLSPDSPVATQYNYNVAEGGGENGARRAPSDLTAVDFDNAGNAWFASPDGLVRINAEGVGRFRESEGVRGDVVNDLARGLGDRLFFCTSEGLGARRNDAFEFPITGSSAMPRPIALAADTSGYLWGAGPRGLWRYDGQNWQRIGRAQGLTQEEFNDLAIDSQNRVWLSTAEGIVLYDPAVRQE
jgi:ligand-binding sensor domain-containing protein